MARKTVDNVPSGGNLSRETVRDQNGISGNTIMEKNNVLSIERDPSPLDLNVLGGDREGGESEESEGEKASGKDHRGFGNCVAGSWGKGREDAS